MSEGDVWVHNYYIGGLTSSTIEGVRRGEGLMGQMFKNGDELVVNVQRIYKQEGYKGKVFQNLLNYLDDVGKQQGTQSLRITFETISDKPTTMMYAKQTKKYGFDITGKLSPVGRSPITGELAIDITWFK